MHDGNGKQDARRTLFVADEEYVRGQKVRYAGRIWFIVDRQPVPDQKYPYRYEAEEIR